MRVDACAIRAVQQLQSCSKVTSAGRATQRRERRTDGGEVAGTELGLGSDLLLSRRLHFRPVGSFNSRLPFPPRWLLPSGPTFFGGLAWMWQHSLAAVAGVSYGMRGNMTGKGGRMRPMSRGGNHAGQQATLRLLWKSPHVMHSGALRKALPSGTCGNTPVFQ